MERASLPLISNLLLFGRVLRRTGIDVHPGRLLDVVEALRHVNVAARDEVYHTCRALLVHRHEHLAIFDREFERFWRERSGDEVATSPRANDRTIEVETFALQDLGDGLDVDESSHDAPIEHGLPTWSDRGVLATKDFAAFTPAELVEGAAALSQLVWSPGKRRTRRWVRGRGPRIDLRRAVTDSVRTGGDVISFSRRMRRVRTRPLVLLCDISRSMEQYSRMLLHFAHAVMARQRRVEAFVFSTELTRITRQLRIHRPNAALAAVSNAVPDWSGGTRIGAAVREFHQRWGRRVLAAGPVVLLISDGWDRGDPAELASEIARLQRSSHRLIWLSPLLGSADYAPLTRGLQAALPFVDDFLPARTLTNVAELALHLNALA
jgi:uncharacterized protein with von Willebrand factor type A (vWA) domain